MIKARDYNCSKYVKEVFELTYFHTLKQAVKFMAPRLVVKATRRSHDKISHTEILITVGKPNFSERAFIKKCLKAGESFPVKKIQVK